MSRSCHGVHFIGRPRANHLSCCSSKSTSPPFSLYQPLVTLSGATLPDAPWAAGTETNDYREADIITRPLAFGERGGSLVRGGQFPARAAHWAVLIGDFYHELVEEKSRIRYRRGPKADIDAGRPYTWTARRDGWGVVTESDIELRDIGEFEPISRCPKLWCSNHLHQASDVIAEMPSTYSVATNNCKDFVANFLVALGFNRPKFRPSTLGGNQAWLSQPVGTVDPKISLSGTHDLSSILGVKPVEVTDKQQWEDHVTKKVQEVIDAVTAQLESELKAEAEAEVSHPICCLSHT